MCAQLAGPFGCRDPFGSRMNTGMQTFMHHDLLDASLDKAAMAAAYSGQTAMQNRGKQNHPLWGQVNERNTITGN